MDPMPEAPAVPAAGPEAAPAAPSRVRHPLTLPHFRNLWTGASISLLGDQLYMVALPWLVLQLTGSGLALGTILMTAAIPQAGLMLLGGAVTDRFSPRRVLITTAVVRTLLVGTVAALIGLHAIRLWELYLLTFAFGVADAFSAPAGPALIPTLVQAEQLPPANALLQSSTVAAQMVGPAPAGFLIKRWGIATALFLDALSFLGVIVALWRLPDPPQAPPSADAPPRPSMLHSIGEGLRTVRQDPALLSLMMVNAVLNICVAGPLAVGLAVLAKFRFGSAAAFGTFLSSFSAGFLAGILLGGMWKRPRRRGLQFIAVCALAGVELIAIGLVLKLAAIAALLAVMGLAVGFVNVQFSSWIQMRVDRALIGRVMSVLLFTAVGLGPVSYAVSGALAQRSLRALFIGAGAVLAATSVLALASPAARDID